MAYLRIIDETCETKGCAARATREIYSADALIESRKSCTKHAGKELLDMQFREREAAKSPARPEAVK